LFSLLLLQTAPDVRTTQTNLVTLST
jgi:hypothetical protein